MDLSGGLTVFDWAAVALVTVSAIVGLARGATREIAGLAALVLAGLLALGSGRLLGSLFDRLIHPAWLARPAGMVAIFLMAYVVLRLASEALSRAVRGAGLGGMDRFLGLGVGAARGVIAIGVLILVLGSIMPGPNMPGWIGHARLYPFARGAGDILREAAPRAAAFANPEQAAGPGAAPARSARTLTVVEDPH